MNDYNAEIAEKIMGWEVYPDLRMCRDPKEQEGALGKLPDFLVLPRPHELLRQTMKNRGYELTVTENPTDLERNIGRTFTASFSRQSTSFQVTESEERLAVCKAALKAYGVLLPACR